VTRRATTVALAMSVLAAGACARAAGPASEGTPAPRAELPATVPAAQSWEDSVLATLSLRERAAQLVWPFVLGDYAPDDAAAWQRLRAWVETEKVGGFIISVGSPTEIAVKLNALQRMSGLPLMFGADYEFGAGYRARGGYFLPNAIDLGSATIFAPQMAYGATRDTALAYAQGRITALEGRALGVHMAFAPILDVNNNPANPVISTRSYGEDPRLDARLGAAFVRGVQDHGMIATGKHFPGHGDTETNSHLALPSVNVSRARLDSVELVPFRAAVAAGVGAMMTFHGAMPALDSTGVPGTLSERVLTDLLREEMGFQGLIVSDAMDMRGVLDRFGAADATKRAIAAGADILIQPLDVTQTIDAVVAGVSEGRYPEARVTDAARRILAAKRKLGLHRHRTVSIDSIRAVVGVPGHVAVARTAAERSITLVKDSLGLVPLKPDTALRILSISLARRADLAAGTAFDAELRTGYRRVRTEWVNADDPAPNFARLLAAADSVDAVIVSSYMGHAFNATSLATPGAFSEFVRTLSRRGRRPIFVAFGNPYALQHNPELPAYLVAWGGFPVSQAAAARAIAGRTAIAGRLPITIPGLAAFGAGLSRDPLAKPAQLGRQGQGQQSP